MRETSLSVDPLIERYVRSLDPVASQLPKKRLHHPRLRDLAIRLGYEISGGSNWQTLIPVCASYELLNCSSYYFNWIFDNKGGDKSQERINDLIMAGVELREVSEQVLRDFNLSHLINGIHEVNQRIYQGQKLDLRVLRAANMGSFRDFNEYLKTYYARCSGLSGAFYALGLSVGAGFTYADSTALHEIGELLGAGLQASNDLGDIALPSESITVLEKPYKDQLSDLRQGKLTLPVYVMLTRGTPSQRRTLEQIIGKDYLSEIEYRDVIGILFDSKAFDTSLEYLKKIQKRAKKKLYDAFVKSESRDIIARMLVAISSNKFITAIKQCREMTV